MRSFYNSAILIITRLATDEDGGLFTLTQFKNRVLQLVKDEYREAFKLRLRKARFDKELKNLLSKTRDLRHHTIGHTTRSYIAGDVKLPRPDILGLRELREALNSLLDALAFNVEYAMLPIAYDPRVLPKRKTDIEQILDCFAKNSHWLNMPEKYPERWKYRRLRLSEDRLRAINQYRRKFQMPEV